jgi:energy-coupling factor transporter ATP-binding protein EcfA2
MQDSCTGAYRVRHAGATSLVMDAKEDHPAIDTAAAPSGETPSREELLAPMRDTLQAARRDLEASSARFPALKPAIRAMRKVESWLMRPVRIVIMGEFNSGKSTLANLLIGLDTLPTSVLACTSRPTLTYFSDAPTVVGHYHDGRRAEIDEGELSDESDIIQVDVGLPAARLRHREIVDLPGLESPSATVEPTKRILRQPDIVLWCTVCTQAWKESERAAWAEFVNRKQHASVLVATFGDLLAAEADRSQVLARLTSSTRDLFDEVLMVSAADALLMRSSPQGSFSEDLWREAGADALEAALGRMTAVALKTRIEAAQNMLARLSTKVLAQLA